MRAPKETPPAATEGAEENNPGSDELSARERKPHEAIRSPQFPLTRPPGLVGDIADYIYASAPRQMIEAALLAGLGLVAGIAGRCFNVHGSGLNVYLMLLAQTGRGKNAMAKGIRRLLTVVRQRVPMVDDFLGPDSFTAGSSLHRYIAEHPSVLLLFGEYGQQLKQMTDPRAHPNDQQMLRLMQQLYSSSGAGDFLPARVYSDKERTIPAVQSPAASILCESQPGTIYGILSHEQIDNGVLPRFLILECPPGNRPPRNPRMNMPPPEELTTRIGDLAGVALNAMFSKEGGSPRFVDIAIEPVARAQLDAIDKEFDDLYNCADAPGEKELWNRAFENVCRIAGVVSVGVNMHQPVITTECVTWANDFVRLCISGLLSRFASGQIGIGETRQDSELRKYILEYLRMKPLERRKKYNVAQKIMGHPVIPYGYLRRRAKMQGAFTQDRRGFDAALRSSIVALVKEGAIMRVNETPAFDSYGVRGELYSIADPSAWGVDIPTVRRFWDT